MNFFMIQKKQLGKKTLWYLGQYGDADSAMIAARVKLSYREYRDTMLNQFNAIQHNSEIYFLRFKDAKKADEWLASVVTMNKLVGK